MQQGTISPLDSDMQWKVDFIRQPAMVQWLVGLRRNSKAPPKTKLAPKNGHGHCLMVCCPSDPLQLSESWQNHYIWELCSANEWDATPSAGTGQQNGPSFSTTTPHHTSDNQYFTTERTGLQSFASSTILTWPLTNQFPLLQRYQLLQAKHSHNQQEAANAFQESVESRGMDFYATGTNKLISCCQSVDC